MTEVHKLVDRKIGHEEFSQEMSGKTNKKDYLIALAQIGILH